MAKKFLAGLLVLALLAGFASPALAVGSCSVFRTWNTGDSFTAGDANSSFATVGVTNMIPSCMDSDSVNVAQMQGTQDPYPAQSESLATNLKGEIERLRAVFKQTLGTSQWYKYTDAFSFGPSPLSGTDQVGSANAVHGASGTGTGIGGAVNLQVAYPAVGSGSSVNALASIVSVSGTNNQAAGQNALVSLTPTARMSATAGYTSLLVNQTETSVGSGQANLLDLQVAGTSKFRVTNAGLLVASGAGSSFPSIALTNNTNQIALGTTNIGTITMAALGGATIWTLPAITGTVFLAGGGQTVTSGVWNGTIVGTTFGGTGLDTHLATNGQLLIGNGSGFTLSSLTPGSANITITPGAGSITIDATGGMTIGLYASMPMALPLR